MLVFVSSRNDARRGAELVRTGVRVLLWNAGVLVDRRLPLRCGTAPVVSVAVENVRSLMLEEHRRRCISLILASAVLNCTGR